MKAKRKQFKEKRPFSNTNFSLVRVKLDKDKEELNLLLNHVDFDKQVQFTN